MIARMFHAVIDYFAVARQQLVESRLDESFAGMFTQYGTLDLPYVTRN